MTAKRKRPLWSIGSVLAMVLLLAFGCLRIPEENRIVSHMDAMETMDRSVKCPNCLNPGSTFPYDVDRDASDPEIHEPGLSADGFTLVSWNIYKGQKKGWVEDFEKFARKTDILVLQEAHLTDTLKDLLHRSEYQWNMSNAFEYRNVSSGVLTAARTTPTFTCMLREAEPIIRIPKSVLVSLYPISERNQKLLVANIHGINFTIGHAAFQKQIDRMENVLAEHPGPMIVSGDFNTWSAGRQAHVNAMVQRLRLTAVQFKKNNRSRFFGYDIDHVYYRGLEPNHAMIPIVSSSDHNPLFVTFKLDTSQDETH